MAEGHAFGKDTVWQKQFEDLFPYQETEDQLRCIEEIKRDMESPRPMDRLLCGDVGYGKTEVAMRAVFKAVMDGKQVAYLVPNTHMRLRWIWARIRCRQSGRLLFRRLCPTLSQDFYWLLLCLWMIL